MIPTSSKPSVFYTLSVHFNQAAILFTFFCVWVLAYFGTFSDIVEIWFSSTTFEHAVLIVPVAAWLIYRKRYVFSLAKSNERWNYIGFLALLGAVILYVVGKLSLVNAIEHFSVMAMPLFFVWAVFGFTVLRQLFFPLFFIILAVPFGEFIIPSLQEITADITVFFLNLANVPVYREGWYLQIPEGLFHVAEACSGIRFLFSTITIGLLIAHLDIKSRARQLVFMACVCIIPIIANGMRAFIMVYIGHVSDMQAAVGFDHLVYGWVFFFIVTVAVLLFSRIFYDDKQLPAVSSKSEPLKLSKVNLIIAAIIVAAGPVFMAGFNAERAEVLLETSENTAANTDVISVAGWHPVYSKFDDFEYQHEWLNNNAVHFHRFTYLTEREGKELITWQNKPYDPERWSIANSRVSYVNTEIGRVNFKFLELKSSSSRTINLVYTWKVGQHYLANPLAVKAYQLAGKFSLDEFGGEALFAATTGSMSAEALALALVDIEKGNSKP